MGRLMFLVMGLGLIAAAGTAFIIGWWQFFVVSVMAGFLGVILCIAAINPELWDESQDPV